jgi:hypothetical protein
MPIFFRPRPTEQSIHQHIEPLLMTALDMDKIGNPEQRRGQARRMLSELPALSQSPQQNPPIIWWRVGIAFALLLVLFTVSLFLTKTPEYSKASDSLLHCFELLFTATIGLLGIEAAKNG